MPAILKIGLSKKLTKDYNSTGFSIDLQCELPQSAVADPNEMAGHTDHLFALAEDLLAEQVRKAQGQPAATPLRSSPSPEAVTRHGNGNGNGQVGNSATGSATNPSNNRRVVTQNSGNGSNGSNNRGITTAQITAIERMAKRSAIDPNTYSQDEWGTPFKQLSIKQASEMIDALKGLIEAGNSQGAAR